VALKTDSFRTMKKLKSEKYETACHKRNVHETSQMLEEETKARKEGKMELINVKIKQKLKAIKVYMIATKLFTLVKR
jgi:hypothetical protein